MSTACYNKLFYFLQSNDTMNSTKTEHTALKGTSVTNRPDLRALSDSNAILHSSLATNASNHNSCMVDVLRKNEGIKIVF